MEKKDLKHRSRALTEGSHRAPARAMFKAVGFGDDDLRKPLVAIANTWTEIGPCNFHLRELAAAVKEGVRAAGGTPMEFNTISVNDGITMGTEGMKASLISREVIADSIELVAGGHMFDAVVALSSCDKTIPGTVMALARLDVPALMLYGGSIAPGQFHGRSVSIQDVFEAVGANAKGMHVGLGFEGHGRPCLSRAGRLRRAVHGQHDGHGLRVPGNLAARQQQHCRHGRTKTEGGLRCRRAGDGAAQAGHSPFADTHPGGFQECRRQRFRLGRIKQRSASSAGDCPRGRRSFHAWTISTGFLPRCRCFAT